MMSAGKETGNKETTKTAQVYFIHINTAIYCLLYCTVFSYSILDKVLCIKYGLYREEVQTYCLTLLPVQAPLSSSLSFQTS